MFSNSGGFVFGALAVYVIVVAVVVFVAYVVIRTAILRALNSHYKTVRMFEKTGEWWPGYQGQHKPRDLDSP